MLKEFTPGGSRRILYRQIVGSNSSKLSGRVEEGYKKRREVDYDDAITEDEADQFRELCLKNSPDGRDYKGVVQAAPPAACT